MKRPASEALGEAPCITCSGRGYTWPSHSVMPKPQRCENCRGMGVLRIEDSEPVRRTEPGAK